MQEQPQQIPPQEPKPQNQEPVSPPQQETIQEQTTEQQLQPFRQEKKELFRREEVRTMRKDLNRLLEEEAQKERERMSQLKTAEEVKKEQERIARLKKEEEEQMFAVKEELLRTKTASVAQEEKEKTELAAREQLLAQEAQKAKVVPKPAYRLPFPLPKKPAFVDKFLSRAVVIGLMIAFWAIIITFWYWYLVVRPKGEPVRPLPALPEETQPPGETPPPQEAPPQEPPPQPIPEIPQSIIPVNQDALVEFSSEEELPSLFSQAVQQYRGEDVFTRLVMRNTSNNTMLSLPDFFRIFQVQTQPRFLEKLSPAPTFFVYSSIIANRFGLAAQIINTEGFEAQVRSWEQTMEQDAENLFALLGKREPSGAKFRQAVYKDVVFRYVSFPSINFGIVWSILSLSDPAAGDTKQYFVFTSSGESMMRIVDRVSDRLVR